MSDCDISDHYGIFTFLNNVLSSVSNNNEISYRVINESSLKNLCNSLSSVDYAPVLQTDDIDYSIEKLDSISLEHSNLYCPIVTKNISKKDKKNFGFLLILKDWFLWESVITGWIKIIWYHMTAIKALETLLQLNYGNPKKNLF